MRVWNFSTRARLSNKRKELQVNIEALDVSLMNEVGSASQREQRVTLLKEMVEMDHFSQIEVAQKIQDSVEH